MELVSLISTFPLKVDEPISAMNENRIKDSLPERQGCVKFSLYRGRGEEEGISLPDPEYKGSRLFKCHQERAARKGKS